MRRQTKSGGRPGQTVASSATVRGLNFSLGLEASAASLRRETGTTDSWFKWSFWPLCGDSVGKSQLHAGLESW